jgi:hypothetical protein
MSLFCYGLADVVKASPELGVLILRELGDALKDEADAQEFAMAMPLVAPEPVPRARRRRRTK